MIKPLPELEALQKKYFLAIDEAFKAKTVLGEEYFEEMRKDLIDRYRIEREQLKRKAIIPDKNIDYITKLQIYELTPHRCGFLYLKINEARDLLNRETDVEDRSELDLRWEAVEQREEEIFPPEPEEPEEHRSFWQRLFHKKNKPAAMESSSQSGSATPAQPSELSNTATGAHGASDAAHVQLEKIIKQADETPHSEAFDQPEPPTAPPTLDTPPAPVQPSDKPKKRQRKPKTESTAEPPVPEQLAGQINIDEIAPAQVVERSTT